RGAEHPFEGCAEPPGGGDAAVRFVGHDAGADFPSIERGGLFVRTATRVGWASLLTCVVAACAAAAPGGVADGTHALKFGPAATVFVPSGPPPPSPATGPVCHFLCYSPAQIQQAYDFPTGGNAPTGDGQRIVVVTAFGRPTLEA